MKAKVDLTIAHFLPEGRETGKSCVFRDRHEHFSCSQMDAGSLVLRGELPAGLYAMSLSTRDGGFDVDTTMIELTEWPSMQTVKCGPFDFDHPQYRMAVPTFRVQVGDTDWGLVWCEVPSPEDMAAGRIRAVWGVRVAASGPTEIRLTISAEDQGRLHWENVAEIVLSPDERDFLPFQLETDTERPHPRLLADAEIFAQLGQDRNPIQEALLQRLIARIESGRDGAYDYRTSALALLGRVSGKECWVKEAIQRTLTLCARAEWGYHDAPEIMGWNNDRDAGDRMLETALVFDWLYDALDASARQTIIAKLERHAAIAERITTLQRNYWYYRTSEAHGQGLWNGFAAAAAALLGHSDKAPAQLEWVFGNLDDALRHLPDDGVADWPTFNTRWHIYSLALFEILRGRALEGHTPCGRGRPECVRM